MHTAEYQSQYGKEWHKRNKAKIKEDYREWCKDNPDKVREASWKKRGIELTCDQYENLLITQEFKCLICEKHVSEFKKRLAVDHDHETGQVRGLLCNGCNRLVGTVESKSIKIDRIRQYLGRN